VLLSLSFDGRVANYCTIALQETHGYMAKSCFRMPLLLSVLFLLTTWRHTTDAAFTEYFRVIQTKVVSNVTSTRKYIQATPFLWVQRGSMEQGGRAAPNDRYSLLLAVTSDGLSQTTMAAVTELLIWDGSNTTLSFFYLVQPHPPMLGTNPDTPTKVQLGWSTNGRNWTLLWNSSLSWYETNQWYGVRVRLPVSAATPQFALKWVNTDQGIDKGETPSPVRKECT
jgi:hypothetical protein